MALNPLNHHYAMENPASVYDEEAMTALELAGRTTAKVNETVRAFNELESQTNEHLENQDKTIAQRMQAQDNAIAKMNNETMPTKVKTEFQKNLDNGTFEGMVDTYAGNLEARVDNLLGAVPEGGTSMDAEVIDARTDHHGKTWANAGQAIRENIGRLENNQVNAGAVVYTEATTKTINSPDVTIKVNGPTVQVTREPYDNAGGGSSQFSVGLKLGKLYELDRDIIMEADNALFGMYIGPESALYSYGEAYAQFVSYKGSPVNPLQALKAKYPDMADTKTIYAVFWYNKSGANQPTYTNNLKAYSYQEGIVRASEVTPELEEKLTGYIGIDIKSKGECEFNTSGGTVTITEMTGKIAISRPEYTAESAGHFCVRIPLGKLSEINKTFHVEYGTKFNNVVLSTLGYSATFNPVYGNVSNIGTSETFNPYEVYHTDYPDEALGTVIYLCLWVSNNAGAQSAYYNTVTVWAEKDSFVMAHALSDELWGQIGTKGTGVVCWGDSLTAQGGWTDVLANRSGRAVKNAGVGGENSNVIMARQGADVMLVDGFTIPADTVAVQVATFENGGFKTTLGNNVRPLVQGGSAHINPVVIGGVEGTLSLNVTEYGANQWIVNKGSYTFTRSVAGDAVTIDRPTAVVTMADRKWNNPELMVIFMGQNDGNFNVDELINKHRLMIDHAHAQNVVVLGLSSGTATSRASYESAMKKAFGRHFISLREYLSLYGLADAGLTATAEDTTAMSVGQVPPQLLADSVHYTSACKTVIGNMLYKKCVELNIF